MSEARDFTVADIPLAFAPVMPELVMYTDDDGKPLSGTEIRLWCVLAMHRDLRSQATTAGTVRMADMLGVDRTTAQRAANRLVKAGFLIHLKRRRDKETGTYLPATFILAVSSRPIKLGIVASEEVDAQLHNDDEVHEASVQTHDAHHDAHHDANGSPEHSINARVKEKERERKENSPEGTAEAVTEAKEQKPTNYMDVYTEAAKLFDYEVTPEDRKELPGNLKKLAEHHDDATMRKVVWRCLDARANRSYSLSPQRAAKELEGNVSNLDPAKTNNKSGVSWDADGTPRYDGQKITFTDDGWEKQLWFGQYEAAGYWREVLAAFAERGMEPEYRRTG